jgi:hypothetical protein
MNEEEIAQSALDRLGEQIEKQLTVLLDKLTAIEARLGTIEERLTDLEASKKV